MPQPSGHTAVSSSASRTHVKQIQYQKNTVAERDILVDRCRKEIAPLLGGGGGGTARGIASASDDEEEGGDGMDVEEVEEEGKGKGRRGGRRRRRRDKGRTKAFSAKDGVLSDVCVCHGLVLGGRGTGGGKAERVDVIHLSHPPMGCAHHTNARRRPRSGSRGRTWRWG